MLGTGIPEVVRQQGVHHHPSQRQAMAQQDQTVVFRVLERLGMAVTGQPGCQGLKDGIETELGRQGSV